HRRPWHKHRRHRGRVGHLRLVERTLPGRGRSVAGVSRAGLPRDVRHVRLPDEVARRVAARPGRMHEPVQRLPVPARTGDAAAADGATRVERARGRAVLAAAPGCGARPLPGPARQPVRVAGFEVSAQGGGRGVRVRPGWWTRGWYALHSIAALVEPPGECW